MAHRVASHALAGGALMRAEWWTKLLLGIGTMLVVPPSALIASFMWSGLQTKQYYRSRPLLQAMHEASAGSSLKADMARAVLLRLFPPGTASEAATSALAGDGFHCQRFRRANPGPLEKALLHYVDQRRGAPGSVSDTIRIVCQQVTPAQIGDTRWIVDMTMGDDDPLKDIRVSILGISF